MAVSESKSGSCANTDLQRVSLCIDSDGNVDGMEVTAKVTGAMGEELSRTYKGTVTPGTDLVSEAAIKARACAIVDAA